MSRRSFTSVVLAAVFSIGLPAVALSQDNTFLEADAALQLPFLMAQAEPRNDLVLEDPDQGSDDDNDLVFDEAEEDLFWRDEPTVSAEGSRFTTIPVHAVVDHLDRNGEKIIFAAGVEAATYGQTVAPREPISALLARQVRGLQGPFGPLPSTPSQVDTHKTDVYTGTDQGNISLAISNSTQSTHLSQLVTSRLELHSNRLDFTKEGEVTSTTWGLDFTAFAHVGMREYREPEIHQLSPVRIRSEFVAFIPIEWSHGSEIEVTLEVFLEWGDRDDGSLVIQDYSETDRAFVGSHTSNQIVTFRRSQIGLGGIPNTAIGSTEFHTGMQGGRKITFTLPSPATRSQRRGILVTYASHVRPGDPEVVNRRNGRVVDMRSLYRGETTGAVFVVEVRTGD